MHRFTKEVLFQQRQQEKGIRVGLKPTVNCKDGTWRAYISFFEHDVPCEPKWENWFASYVEFQTHYARIAEEEQCDIFIAGCEMVMTEHREKQWREVIASICREYHGLVSYNTDKYQEDQVSWWDCVDMISSSGYYPIDQWEQELDRIEKTVLKYQKPFFLPKRDVCREKAPGWFRITGNCRENFAWKNSVNGIVQCLKPVRRDHGFVALLYGSGHQSCPLRVRHGRTTAMKYVRNRCRR